MDKQGKNEKGEAIIVCLEQTINVASFIHIAKSEFFKKPRTDPTGLVYQSYKGTLDLWKALT